MKVREGLNRFNTAKDEKTADIKLVGADRWRHGLALLAQSMVDDGSVVDFDISGVLVDPCERVLAPMLRDGLLLLTFERLAVIVFVATILEVLAGMSTARLFTILSCYNRHVSV